jgi:hypothetical protein
VSKPWVARHAFKPEGKLSVAPDSDKRPAELPEQITDFESPIEPTLDDLL